MTPFALLAARILLAILFIVAGLGKLADVQAFTGYMAAGGVPAFLAWPVIALELLGGIAVLLGFQTRIAALALGGFSILAGLMFHFDPANQMQMTMFMKNLGLGGGFLLLAITGAGAWSIDALTGRTPATA
ncbi:MAG: DoxX family protein [Rhodobacter sp.]|nr:DoxX family protein [Paracoccaceae bacterium]MCC0079305.1 DoxX family protein [Rhodobacter sp.]